MEIFVEWKDTVHYAWLRNGFQLRARKWAERNKCGIRK
jgi:hypothetical protein